MDYAAVIGSSFPSSAFHDRHNRRRTTVSLRTPNFFNPKHLPNTPLPNPPSLLLLSDRRARPLDCLRTVGSVRGGDGEDAMEGKPIPVWFKVGGLVALVALAMLVVRCKAVVAADGVVRDLKDRVLGMRWWDPDVVKNSWPKVLMALKLFKEQGLVLFFLLGVSGFFSMSETAITTLWPWKVRELAEKESDNGVFKILRNDVNRFLTTILIGTTVASIAATAIFTDAATAIFGEAGVTAATAVMTVAVLLLTEITPKSIGIHNATEVAKIVVRPIALLSVILYPVGKVATYLSMGIQKMLGLKARSEPYVTENELKLMLRGAELSGAIEEEEQDMIENVLMIKDTVVREVMTPLVDVVAIDANVKLIDFQKLWVTKQYSRVPVFEQRVDNIVGIAFAMDMLEYVEQVEKLDEFTVLDIVHNPTYFVPDSMSVWNLLREFRIRKVHMAVVLNEYGGTIGIVTLEDVVEEIVGEIFDENDSKEEIHRKTGFVVMLQDGSFLVDANTSMDQLSEELNIELPEGHQYETVSGFICESFGCIPNKGSKIKVKLEKSIEEENDDDAEFHHQNNKEREKHQIFEIEILEANARRVESVVLKPINDVDVSVEFTRRDEKRLVSTKVVKRRKKHNSDIDYNPNTIGDFDEPLSIKNSEIDGTVLQENLNHGVIEEEQPDDHLPSSNQQ